jgi:hypothetical protein
VEMLDAAAQAKIRKHREWVLRAYKKAQPPPPPPPPQETKPKESPESPSKGIATSLRLMRENLDVEGLRRMRDRARRDGNRWLVDDCTWELSRVYMVAGAINRERYFQWRIDRGLGEPIQAPITTSAPVAADDDDEEDWRPTFLREKPPEITSQAERSTVWGEHETVAVSEVVHRGDPLVSGVRCHDEPDSDEHDYHFCDEADVEHAQVTDALLHSWHRGQWRESQRSRR